MELTFEIWWHRDGAWSPKTPISHLYCARGTKNPNYLLFIIYWWLRCWMKAALWDLFRDSGEREMIVESQIPTICISGLETLTRRINICWSGNDELATGPWRTPPPDWGRFGSISAPRKLAKAKESQMMDEWMEREVSLFNNLVCNRNGFLVKGALRSFLFLFFLPQQTK